MMTSQTKGPVILTARWVVGYEEGHHVLYQDGEVVFQGDSVIFAGHGYSGEVARRTDYGNALIGPGFIDLDALSDLDTTVLAFDNQPAWRKGRVWPESYMKEGPQEMYTPEELTAQKRYAFSRLIRNGITTALPIASLFYREWGETWAEFASAAEVAEELGLRVYLGPAYRTGNTFVKQDGTLDFHFDEERGLDGLAEAVQFCHTFEGRSGGLIRTMLAPDRIETCTSELLRRSATAAGDLEVPVRLHCCQSVFEYETVLKLHGMSPPQWLASFDFLSERSILPHVTIISGAGGITREAPDLEIIRDAGASIAHCPLVMARHGAALHSFRKYCDMGLNLGMGTDTHPPDMILNMQLGLLLCRTVEADAQASRAEDFYNASTLGGASALGRSDLGRLSPGAKADLIVIDLDEPTMGQTIDPIQTLMLNGSGRDVHTVVINGRFVMEDGCIPGIDDRELRRQAQSQFNRLVAQYPRRTFGQPKVEEIFSSSYQLIGRPS